jgi:hypothetical protein
MPTQLHRVHTHPITGPVAVIHSTGVLSHENVIEMPMHAFGPFTSEDEARLFHEHNYPSDQCTKTIIDIYEPVWETYPERTAYIDHLTGACGINEAHSDEDHER